MNAHGASSNAISLTVLFGVLGIFSICAPGQLKAQAPAGPITPPQSTDEVPPPWRTAAAPPPAAASRSSVPAEKPAPRQNIGGSWNFNKDASDDGSRKVDEARHGGGTQQTGPVGGNVPYGGGPWGGGYPYPGGSPYPNNGPYGGGPWGGRQAGTPRGGYGDQSDQSPAMREYIYPASEVTFILKDNEADLTDDTARKRVFFTDGRKLQKPKDENYREIAAHWEGNRLVADEKLPGGERVRRVFELSSDGRQLDEEVDLDATRARDAVTLHYVYNINTNRE